MTLDSFDELLSARMQLKKRNLDAIEKAFYLSRRWRMESGQFCKRSRRTDLFCSSSSYILVNSISWLESSL